MASYIRTWEQRDYSDGIPEEVPDGLMRGLAPSYKEIAIALLKNDVGLLSLGFTPPATLWYSILKQMEIDERPCNRSGHRQLFLQFWR